jgi:ribosomal-protein-alanine N-acetyltransferase
MVYARYPKHLELLNIAVHPGFRRQWVGHQLLSKLKTKLKQSNRPFLNLYTRESNFTAHCFFREAGFRADRVLRSYYEDSGEDAYEFYFTHRRDDA